MRRREAEGGSEGERDERPLQDEDGDGADGGSRSLLLSLEHAASGTNLTAANHALWTFQALQLFTEGRALRISATGRLRPPDVCDLR